MAAAYRCEMCNGEPMWRLDRRGDAVVSWACDPHLPEVCRRLQRDWEITELVVSHAIKRREWAKIAATLGEVT